MKTFLITGHKGLLGSHLLKHFEEQGNTVYGFGRNEFNNLRIGKVPFNCKEKIDVIIHCGGEIYDERIMYDINVNFTKEILEYVKEHPETEMINISSSSIYGKVDYPTSEQDLLRPEDIYSSTKGAASLLCIGYSKRYKLKITDVRPYTIFGVGEKAHKLLPTLYRAFEYKEPMTLCDGNHDFVYIDDFVDAIEKILNKKDKPFGEIVNVGSGVQTSNFDVYISFALYFGFDAQCVELNQDSYLRERDTQYWCCHNIYSKEYYGIEYKYNVDNGVEAMLNNLKKNQTEC